MVYKVIQRDHREFPDGEDVLISFLRGKFMRRFSLRHFPIVLVCLFLAATSQGATGRAELDKVLQSDYGQWGRMVEANLDLYLKELKGLNPYFEAGSRESITSLPQKVILSLMAMKKNKGAIVELGSWTGGGVLLMAPFLVHDKSYHAVDTFNAEHMPDRYVKDYLKGRKHLDVFKANIAPLVNKVVIHQGLTTAVAATWPKAQAIDLLFIDADHSFKGVSADWKNWSPFVRKGGIVVFHDYYLDVKKYGHPGVRRFVDGLTAGKKIKNFNAIEGLAWYVVE
jgi:predicted O-methyltransferase YrrM